MWFNDWNGIYEIVVRGVVCFVGLIVLLRIGGKRTLTKMNAFDFIMTFTIGSTLSAVITSKSITISEGMMALAVIIGVQYIIAWLEVRSNWFQELIKSEPSVLFKRGEFQERMMRSERITRQEVLAAMRYAGLADPSQVDYVLMETDGQLSVIPRNVDNHGYGALKPVAGDRKKLREQKPCSPQTH